MVNPLSPSNINIKKETADVSPSTDSSDSSSERKGQVQEIALEKLANLQIGDSAAPSSSSATKDKIDIKVEDIKQEDIKELKANLLSLDTFESEYVNFQTFGDQAISLLVNISKAQNSEWKLNPTEIDDFASACSARAGVLFNDQVPLLAYPRENISQVQAITSDTIKERLTLALNGKNYCPIKDAIEIAKNIAETKVATEVAHLHNMIPRTEAVFPMYYQTMNGMFEQCTTKLLKVRERVEEIEKDPSSPADFKQTVRDMIVLEELYQAFQAMAYLKLTKLMYHERQLQPSAFLEKENLKGLLARIVSHKSADDAIARLGEIRQGLEYREAQAQTN